MLNSSIESAVTASSARRPEPATSETEVSVRSFSKRSWRSGQAGGKKELVGCRRAKRLCQWDRERTQVGVLGLTTRIPSSTATSSETEKGGETDSLLIKGAMEPVSVEQRGVYSNLFLVKKQDINCHQLKGPELIYKETNFQDGNVERRFAKH